MDNDFVNIIEKEPWKKFFEHLEPIPFEERHKYIGGTSAAAVINANPYLTPFELWNIMVNNVEPQRSVYAEKKLKAGKKLEKVILEFFVEEFHPDDILYFTDMNLSFKSKIYDFIAITPDAVAIRDGKSYVVELKNMGMRTAKEFIEGNVPINYLCQASLYAEILGVDYIVYGVLIDGYDFKIFGPFERDPDFVRVLIENSQKFIKNYVETKKAPDPQTLKEVFALYPQSNAKRLAATKEMIKVYQESIEIQKQIKKLEMKLEQNKTKIAKYLGEFEELIVDNKTIVKYKTVDTQRFDTKAFQKENPEIYEKYLKTSPYRRFEFIINEEEE